MRKSNAIFALFVVLVLLLQGCKKDKYDEGDPTLVLTSESSGFQPAPASPSTSPAYDSASAGPSMPPAYQSTEAGPSAPGGFQTAGAAASSPPASTTTSRRERTAHWSSEAIPPYGDALSEVVKDGLVDYRRFHDEFKDNLAKFLNWASTSNDPKDWKDDKGNLDKPAVAAYFINLYNATVLNYVIGKIEKKNNDLVMPQMNKELHDKMLGESIVHLAVRPEVKTLTQLSDEIAKILGDQKYLRLFALNSGTNGDPELLNEIYKPTAELFEQLRDQEKKYFKEACLNEHNRINYLGAKLFVPSLILSHRDEFQALVTDQKAQGADAKLISYVGLKLDVDAVKEVDARKGENVANIKEEIRKKSLHTVAEIPHDFSLNKKD